MTVFNYITGFYPLNNSDIFTRCYFHKSVIFTVCENNKRLWRHVMHCMQCLKFEQTNTKENVINRKFRTLDVEYWIYFTSKSNFLIFSLVLRIRENNKQKSCLTHEINSIFNIKSSEFSVYYISIFNFKPFNILYIYQKNKHTNEKKN